MDPLWHAIKHIVTYTAYAFLAVFFVWFLWLLGVYVGIFHVE